MARLWAPRMPSQGELINGADPMVFVTGRPLAQGTVFAVHLQDFRPGTTICDRTTLPSGAVNQNINGTTYFVFGGDYYRPFGSSVIYQVVAKPS